MTPLAARACAIVFLIVIFTPPVLGVMGMRGTAIENRTLTAFPPVRSASVIDQDFYTALSGFLKDHLPLRDLAVRANSRIAIRVWRDSPNPEVHIGANGWLYTTPFRLGCPGRMPLRVIDAIGSLGRELAATGREMRMVVAPSKAVIYPEFLGAFPPAHFSCAIERLRTIRDRMSQIPEIGLIDLERHLSRLKDTSAEPVYFPGDSHWTLKGAAAMSRALVESIQPGLWRDADVEDVQQIVLPMDLALLIGLPQQVTTTTNRTRRSGITTNVIERLDCEQGPSCTVRYVSSGIPGRLIRQRTLLVRDSFGTMSVETLVPYFEDITLLFWSDDVLEQLARRIGQADLVVYQTLDQYLFARVDTGFTTQVIPPRRGDGRP